MLNRNLPAAHMTNDTFDDGRLAQPSLRSTAEPVVVVDLEGRIRSVNAAFVELTGLSEELLIDRAFDSLCEDGLKGGSVAGRLLRDGRLESLDARLILRGGAAMPVVVSGTAVHGRRGGCEAFVLTLRALREESHFACELNAAKRELAKRVEYLEDFRSGVFQLLRELDASETELAETCKSLADAQRQLVHTSRLTAIGELASAMAHELNQPLTVIKGLSQYMLRGAGAGTPEREKLKLITDASSKMETVIKHLRIFARNDVVRQSAVNVNDVINDALLIIKELLTARSIEIALDLSPTPNVIGSSARLEQVIINIAANARDAMLCGGRFTISAKEVVREGNRFAMMSFQDTGGGIPPNFLPKIFDPFFTTKEAGVGTGLGLSISYGIIREHRGEITVENNPPEGCAFHILLPAAPGA